LKRNIGRIKKVGLNYLVRKLVKLERRMERLLKEYYATQSSIEYFQKEKNLKPEEIQNALGMARGLVTPPNTFIEEVKKEEIVENPTVVKSDGLS